MTILPIQTIAPLSAFAPSARARPADATMVGLQQIQARTQHLVRLGADTARSHYLAEATDACDLARRAAAWDRAQAIYRGL